MKASGTVRRLRQGRGPENAALVKWETQEGLWADPVVRTPGWDPCCRVRLLRSAANMAPTLGASWGGPFLTRDHSGIAGSGEPGLLFRGRDTLHDVEARATRFLRVSNLNCPVNLVRGGNSIPIYPSVAVRSRRKL